MKWWCEAGTFKGGRGGVDYKTSWVYLGGGGVRGRC